MWGFEQRKLAMPAPEDALPGRDTSTPVPVRHQVLGTSLT